MSQITIRNMDEAVERIIRQRAQAQDQSLSDVANQLLRQAVGLETATTRKRNLRALAGKWTAEDSAAFEKTQTIFGVIDEEVWK
jgi:plasmid stability protein